MSTLEAINKNQTFSLKAEKVTILEGKPPQMNLDLTQVANKFYNKRRNTVQGG